MNCFTIILFLWEIWLSNGSRVQITEGPSPLSVPSGSPATLHCRTSPPSEVSWWRDGEEVGERDGIMALPDGSLFILAALPEDAGVYMCKVGQRRSRGARLQVRFLEDNFAPVERLVSVEEGAVAILPCTPPIGSPQPKLVWERDGQRVSQTKNVRVEGGSLVIERVEREDEGLYTCIASNSEGEVRDEEITLKVTSTREVILVETKEEEEEGLSLKLWVVAISLAVIVTLALLTITLLVCLRYRRLTLVPMEAVDQVDQVEGSTTSYDSRHGLLYSYNYNYSASQTGKLPGRQSLDRQSSLGSSCRESQNFVFTREKKGGTAQIYKGTEQHYASTPIVRQEYSRPFQYVLVDRGEYVTPHNQYS